MKRLYIVVEGQTEEEFVVNILIDYFFSKGIYSVSPIKIQTSKGHKGGFVNYVHLKNEVNKLLKAQSHIVVTSFVDFYKIPVSVPKYKEAMKPKPNSKKVIELEKAIFEDIGVERFLPYIQLHEFEALLFSSEAGFEKYWESNPRVIKEINDIIKKFPNPEDIDDKPQTSPSNRLIKIIKEYDKIIYGNLISLEIGIETILNKCPRFKNWIDTLVVKMNS